MFTPTMLGPLIFAGALAVSITMLIVSSFALRSKNASFASVPQILTSAAIIAFGLLFAGLHAFPIHHKVDDTYPIIDATVFGAIACILIAYFLPKIKNLKVFGAEIDMQEVVVDLTENVQKVSDLLEKFLTRLGIALVRISEQTTIQEQYETLVAFIRDRLADAKVYISESASIDLRLSVWLAEDDKLTFFISNEINDPETTSKTFAPNEGIIGRAFAEQETWNVADAANSPAYSAVRRSGTPRYGAILVAPISLPGKKIGVLSADKNKNDKFSPSAQKVLEGVAAMLAIAIDVYQVIVLSQSSVPAERSAAATPTAAAPVTRAPSVSGVVGASAPAVAPGGKGASTSAIATLPSEAV